MSPVLRAAYTTALYPPLVFPTDMRLIPTFLAALFAVLALAGCGTKTPLTLPPPEQKSANTAVPPTASREMEGLNTTSLADASHRVMESHL